MKTKTFLILAVLLVISSCKCVIAQIPPQYLYINETCQAVIPDYTTRVVASDNCGPVTITQSPGMGSVIGIDNPSVRVTIRATDRFNNFSEVFFQVTAIDTVPPVITADTSLFTQNWATIHSIYDQADRLLAEQETFFDNYFDWENVQLDDSTTVPIPLELRPTAEYNSKMLITWTSPRHAIDGTGGRWFTFENPGDTLILR